MGSIDCSAVKFSMQTKGRSGVHHLSGRLCNLPGLVSSNPYGSASRAGWAGFQPRLFVY
jgi:hypothetical protein